MHRIFKSGSIIGSLIPKKAFKDSVVLKRSKLGLGISTNAAKKSVLTFKTEFEAEEKLLDKNQTQGTVIIEGHMFSDTTDFLTLVNGLKVKWKRGGVDGLTFKIAILKESDQFRVRTLPSTLVTEFDQTEYNMSDVFLSPNFAIRRIRFTSSKITEDEVAFI